MLFLLAGLVFLVAGSFAFFNNRRLTRNGLRAHADVVNLYVRRGGEDGPTYYPVVRFQTSGGHEVVARTRSGGAPPPARPGDRVRVIYQPDDPRVVSIDTIAGRGVVLSGLFVIVGLGILTVQACRMVQ